MAQAERQPIEARGRKTDNLYIQPVGFEGNEQFLLGLQKSIDKIALRFVDKAQSPGLIHRLQILASQGPEKAHYQQEAQKEAESTFSYGISSVTCRSHPNWTEEQKTIFLRWVYASAILAVCRERKKVYQQPIVGSMALTARRILLRSSQASQAHGFPIDPDWLRELAGKVMDSVILPYKPIPDDLEIFVNNPPLERSQTS